MVELFFPSLLFWKGKENPKNRTNYEKNIKYNIGFVHRFINNIMFGYMG